MHSKRSHRYNGFRNFPEINFPGKIARILTVEMVMENHTFGHGKSWKVMKFHFRGFVGTLYSYIPSDYARIMQVTDLSFFQRGGVNRGGFGRGRRPDAQ